MSSSQLLATNPPPVVAPGGPTSDAASIVLAYLPAVTVALIALLLIVLAVRFLRDTRAAAGTSEMSDPHAMLWTTTAPIAQPALASPAPTNQEIPS